MIGNMMSGTEPTDQLRRLQRLRQLVDGTEDGRLLTRLDDEIRKLEANRFHLVVLGQFKRGKTTFVNALLGEELLPVGVIPVTSVVTLVRYGSEKHFDAVFTDNSRREIQSSDLKEYITEQGNPENRKCIRYVEITHPSVFLKDGIVLVDTPGIGSLYVHNTETTQDFIPHVDAAVVILSADLPVTQTEYQFLGEVAQHVERLFFVLNKSDLFAPSEMEEAVSYTYKVLTERMNDGSIHIVPMSARNALLGETAGAEDMLEQSNLKAFTQMIEAFVREEKLAVLQKRSLDRIERLAGEAFFTTELELKAITTPLTDLETKINEFENQIALLKTERENFGYLLNGQVATLNRWIEEQLDQFATDEMTRLKERITTWARENEERPAKEFQKQIREALASDLVADFDAWRQGNDKLIVGKYEAIISQYAEKTNEFIRRVHQLSADLFQIQLQPFEDIRPLTWKRTFYYKMEDDPVFFEFDPLKLGAVVLPGSVKRQRIVRRANSWVADKVTRHCGRLRYEYEYSIDESFRTFQDDLNGKIDAVINQIYHTLNAAMTMRRDREAMITSRVEGLRNRLDRLRNLHMQETSTP